MTLGGRAFIKEFLEEFANYEKQRPWLPIWDKSGEWTKDMLGDSVSRKKNNYGLIGKIGKTFGYGVDAEWRRIDQVWYYYLPKLEQCKELPWKLDVIIEHENDINNLEYTFYKLGEIISPLKVGIFYPDKGKEQATIEKCIELITKSVTSVTGESYLIIFGFLTKKNTVEWRAHEIDFKGNTSKIT
ncbi:MAG: hypothetical protein ABSE15_00380 [Candidatus Bathyarchaeia archaeon]|jgi:hypothetical protein